MRWFDLTEESTSRPWGDLEICQFNGKYNEHWAAIDTSGGSSTNEVDVRSIEFNPWQNKALVVVMLCLWDHLQLVDRSSWDDTEAMCCLFATMHYVPITDPSIFIHSSILSSI